MQSCINEIYRGGSILTKSFSQNVRRSITGNKGRYIAILLIILLGVAFFTGLKLTRPAMVETAASYLNETKMYDLRVLSNIGFEEAEVEAALEIEGVTAAAGSVQADVLCLLQEEQQVLRTHAITEEINQAELLSGRMPESADEVLADAEAFDASWLGKTISLSGDNDTDTLDLFAYTEYTIVGLVRTPLYLTADRGTTSLGSGTVYSYLLLKMEGYDTDYYTELYLKIEENVPYSEAYEKKIEQLKADAEPVLTGCANQRFDSVIAEAEQEIADGEAELEEKRTEAWAELEDARMQLEDAKAELEEGETTLADSESQLANAKTELDSAAEQLLPGFSSWEEALEAGLADVEAGQDALTSSIASGEATLDEKQAELDAGEAAYQEGYEEWASGQAQYEAALAEWESGYAAYESALSEWESGKAELAAALDAWETDWNSVQAAKASDSSEEEQAALEEQETSLIEAKAALDAQAAALDVAETELSAQGEVLADGKAELDASADTLNQAKAELDASRLTLDEGQTQIDDARAELAAQSASAQAELNLASAQLEEFRSGISEYREGYADYEEGLQSLEDGRLEYEDGLSDYEEGLSEFYSEIADAEAELADAKEELADLTEPELYLLSREESNTGYASFDSDSMIVDNLSSVFPVFFFLIAALVCSTTMTRMIDDDRAEIGTLRALGYSRSTILSKYLIYSGSAAVIGCLIGYFGGGYLFPMVIWIAYQMQYQIPGYICVYSLPLLLLSLAAALLCSVGVTVLNCRRMMRSTPAALIRPLAPEAGKRILLERLTPLWRRLKFLYKVSLRNIFRFKKRMFMMLVGIAGCTALVLTGYGVWDSVGDIGNYQYDDIEKYDIMVNFSKTVTDSRKEEIGEEFSDRITALASLSLSSGDVTGDSGTQTVYFMATDDERFTQLIDLHLNGETVDFPSDGEVVLTEKLASNIGVKAGDMVTLSISDTERGTAVVAALTENYVSNYVYMSGTTYTEVFGNTYEPETLLISTAEDTDDYALGAALQDLKQVASVTVTANTRKTIEDMMSSLNYVVILILACAAALAFIVLFNLGNINITERVREIATIRVLGFHLRDAGSYVFRENLILTVMGIICGLPLGVALHAFAMGKITVKTVNFKTVIQPMSYVWTILLVLLFSILTDLVLRRKIKTIDMAQALKSAE